MTERVIVVSMADRSDNYLQHNSEGVWDAQVTAHGILEVGFMPDDGIYKTDFVVRAMYAPGFWTEVKILPALKDNDE